MKKIILKILVLSVLSFSFCNLGNAMEKKQVELKNKEVDSFLLKRVISFKKFFMNIKDIVENNHIKKGLCFSISQSLKKKFEKMLCSFGKNIDEIEEYFKKLSEDEKKYFINNLEINEKFIFKMIDLDRKSIYRQIEKNMNEDIKYLEKKDVCHELKKIFDKDHFDDETEDEIYREFLAICLVIETIYEEKHLNR